MLLRPLIDLSPMRPPGFEASPTPPLLCSMPCNEEELLVAQPAIPGGLETLFLPGREALLPTPAASPPAVPGARRKTLAGVAISTSGGLSLRRTSARIKAGGRATKAPVAKQAEILVCRSLGIVKNGKDVTGAVLEALEERFKDQLPTDVLEAMRALFKLDDALFNNIEEALIDRAGDAGLDHVKGGPLWMLEGPSHAC